MTAPGWRERKASVLRILLVCVYMLLSVSGIVLIRAGSGRTALSLADGLFQLKLDAFTLGGMCCYVVSFLMFMYILSLYKLSYIVPITTGIVQVLILLAAVIVFREKITTVNLVGVLVVISGIVLMNIQPKAPLP